jgi:hypothetical protein
MQLMKLPRRDLNALAVLLSFAASAVAGDQSASLGVAPTDEPPSTKVAATPQVTVQAGVLEDRVHSYISNVTRVPYWSIDDPVQLWRRPICPLIAGLPRNEGEFVFEHLTAVLTSIGVPRGQPGCHPNFFIVVTSEPESILNGVWDRNWHVFGDESPTLVRKFIDTPRPVRIWYNNIPVGQDAPPGMPPIIAASNLGGTSFAGLPTFVHDGNGLHAEYVMVNDMLSVIAIVDITKVAGLDWGQVTDYIAMAGLTKVDLDADVGDTPSILHLFAASADSSPKGLSDWDQAFLRELYHSNVFARHQRKIVSHLMVQDLLR